MADTHRTFIQLNSGDFTNVGGNASQFRNTLATPFVLDKLKKYEVACMDYFIPVNQIANSVYINLLNLVSESITGSQNTSAVCFIPFTMLGTAGAQLYGTTALARKWYPINVSSFSYVDVSFTQSTGELIPIMGGEFSTITIAIREIGY